MHNLLKIILIIVYYRMYISPLLKLKYFETIS